MFFVHAKISCYKFLVVGIKTELHENIQCQNLDPVISVTLYNEFNKDSAAHVKYQVMVYLKYLRTSASIQQHTVLVGTFKLT